MSMIKPIGYSMSAFDATQSQTFKFTVEGGNQVKYNKIIVRDNTTNATIYENKIESYTLSQTIPSNTLTNGVYYNYSFVTYDTNENASEESTSIPFYCYTTPTVVFTNLPTNNNIQSSSFQFVVQYNQIEDEPLNNLNIYLYDSNSELLQSSGNLTSVMIPPINFVFNVSDLIDEEQYYIQALVETKYGTIVYSTKELLTINYTSPTMFNLVDLTNNCSDGSVTVTNNIVSIDGESNPTPPTYLNERVDLISYDTWIKWCQGYNFKNDEYTIAIWMSVGQVGNFFEMWNESQSNKIYAELVREIPYGETEPKDCFELKGYNNGVQYLYQFSNYITMLNNLKNIVVWIQKKDNIYTLRLSQYSQDGSEIIWNAMESNVVYNVSTSLLWTNETSEETENQLQWNTSSNVEYNRLNTIFWSNDEAKASSISTNKIAYDDDTTSISIVGTKIYNGIFDDINISVNGSREFSLFKPIWDYYTRLDCDFSNNINGGNTTYILTQINSMRIKHRAVGTYEWITLKEIPIDIYSDLNFSYTDKYTPSGVEYEWAIVPVLNGNIEGNYSKNTLTPSFNGVFVLDVDSSHKLYSGVAYNGDTSMNSQGQLQPFNMKYPLFIENSNVDYQTGNISGMILNSDFDTTKQIDRQGVVAQKEIWDKFLKNKKFKIWKDWNGNIKLFKLTGTPTYTYNTSYGNGIITIAFTWTEQGDINSKQDLYELGFIESNV